MPYSISSDGKCVLNADGSVKKCYDNHADALKYHRALMVNVVDATKAKSMVPSPYNAHGPNSLLGILGLGSGRKKKPKVAMKADDGHGGFLVTEADGTKHLPTTRNGKIDRGLLGAAHAALFSSSGFRGKPYAGPNKEEAKSKLMALYKREGLSAPDSVGTKESASSAFSIHTQPDGTHRWILTSSSGFEDSDGETIGTNTLTDDSARMTQSGVYGPLRWWHIGSKGADPITKDPGVGVDLGACDTSFVHSHTLIESGTFYDESIAASLIPHTKELGGSLGFFYPATSGKNITKIHIFERSILPKMHASNLMARVKRIFTQEDSMDEQLAKLKEKVGAAGIDAILADVEKREAENKANGVKLKAAKKPDESAENPKEEAGESKKEEEAEDTAEPDMKKKTKEIVDQISDAIALKMSDKFVTPAMLDAKFGEVNATKTKENDALATALKSISDRLSTLEGETPESKKGFKASESKDTLADSDLTMTLLTQMAQQQGLDLSALGVKGTGPTSDFERVSTRLGKALNGEKA